jgi:hypothetical protein
MLLETILVTITVIPVVLVVVEEVMILVNGLINPVDKKD